MRLVPITSGVPFPFVCATCGVLRHTVHSAQRGRAMADIDGPAFSSFHCAHCAEGISAARILAPKVRPV